LGRGRSGRLGGRRTGQLHLGRLRLGRLRLGRLRLGRLRLGRLRLGRRRLVGGAWGGGAWGGGAPGNASRAANIGGGCSHPRAAGAFRASSYMPSTRSQIVSLLPSSQRASLRLTPEQNAR
jgi:hypothetical protein